MRGEPHDYGLFIQCEIAIKGRLCRLHHLLRLGPPLFTPPLSPYSLVIIRILVLNVDRLTNNPRCERGDRKANEKN